MLTNGVTPKNPFCIASFCVLIREVLGAVAAAKPSGVFRTGWPTNEQMQSCEVVRLGVSIESEVSVRSVLLAPL